MWVLMHFFTLKFWVTLLLILEELLVSFFFFFFFLFLLFSSPLPFSASPTRARLLPLFLSPLSSFDSCFLAKSALFFLNPSPGVSVRRRRTRRLPREQAMRAAAPRAARRRLARAGEAARAAWREGVPRFHGVCFSLERRLGRRSGLPSPGAQC